VTDDHASLPKSARPLHLHHPREIRATRGSRREHRDPNATFPRSFRRLRGCPRFGRARIVSLVPGKILIVDDDQDTCDLLRTYFSGAGYEVEARLDGPSALATFRESPCDVVITDIRMPDMDGIEVLHALKGLDPDAGVIIFSATV